MKSESLFLCSGLLVSIGLAFIKKKKVQKCSKAASLHVRKRYMLSVVSTKFEGAELIFFFFMDVDMTFILTICRYSY